MTQYSLKGKYGNKPAKNPSILLYIAIGAFGTLGFIYVLFKIAVWLESYIIN
jgi:hypothetical protein